MEVATPFSENGEKEKKYDPVQKAEVEAKVVLRGDLRKYYRFRAARFYGGIATADCMGLLPALYLLLVLARTYEA